MPSFVLSAEERKHLSDVKSVVATSTGQVFAGSRDGTGSMMELQRTATRASLNTTTLLVAHEGFVNFILYHPSMPMLDGEPAVITGSNDKHVLVWSAITGAMEAVLDCHSQGVRCGAVIAATGDFVTCGWDKLCILWDGFSGRTKNLFDKHDNSVLCITQLPETSVMVTGSGDKTLMTWSLETAELLHRFIGHSDSVQAVAALNPLQFASSGNDGMVIIWDSQDGSSVFRFQAHEAFVYSMCYAGSRLFTASEDRTVCVWELHEDHAVAVDCLVHPCVVWCVTAAPETDDVLTAGSDAGVRLWTQESARIAHPSHREAMSIAASFQKDDLKTISLPSVIPMEADKPQHPGSRIGARGYFKIAATDEIGSFVWTNEGWARIGTVVQGPGAAPVSAAQGAASRQKVFHQGKYYDYVFDVEISGISLKLTYNSGQSIFDAAQDFINLNGHLGVSQMDREQIQQHILNNIDPADAAKVGGGALGAQGGASGGSAPAVFSEFAKEAEALRARGVAQAKSWGEQFKQLQEGGGQHVAYSTFAKEAQQAAGLSKASGAAQSADCGLAPLTSADIFKGYSADKAAAKVAELVGNRDYDHTINSLDRLVSSGQGDVEEVVTCLVALQAALIETNQVFPVLDCFRLLFSSSAAANEAYLIARDSLHSLILDGVVNATNPCTDADKLCTLRLVANGLAGSSAFAADFMANTSGLCTGLFTWIRTKVLPANNANVKSSLRTFLMHAVLRCVAHYSSATQDSSPGSAAEATALVDVVIATIAQSMLYDSLEEPTRAFLSALLALHRVPSLRQNVQESLGRHLGVVLRAYRNGSNFHFSTAAKELLPL
jgi:phospholipase A-2-activating protein